jgi:hypothetical protein
LYLLLLTSIS